MVLTLSRVHKSGSGRVPSLMDPIGLQTWKGLAGRSYTHTIYQLVGCPAPTTGHWVLVRRSANGFFEALATGFAQHECASLNLAEIRHLAANLGANEVHLDSSLESVEQNAAIASEIAQVEGFEHRVA